MNIITIDPGKRKTGIFLKKEGLSKSFLIDNRKIVKESNIYMNIYTKIFAIINAHEIDVVIMEDYPYKMQANRQLYTSEIKGVIKFALYACAYDVKILTIPINTWKKYVDKKIIAKRKKVAEYKRAVKEYHGWDFSTEDECDAYFMMVAVTMIMKGVIKSGSAQKLYDSITKETI